MAEYVVGPRDEVNADILLYVFNYAGCARKTDCARIRSRGGNLLQSSRFAVWGSPRPQGSYYTRRNVICAILSAFAAGFVGRAWSVLVTARCELHHECKWCSAP